MPKLQQDIQACKFIQAEIDGDHAERLRIKKQIRHEAQWQAAHLIRWTQKPEVHALITAVEEVSCKLDKMCACAGRGCNKIKHTFEEAVVQVIMKKFTHQLNLTKGIFFMRKSICQKYGLLTETDTAQKVLWGKIDYNNIADDATREKYAASRKLRPSGTTVT